MRFLSESAMLRLRRYEASLYIVAFNSSLPLTHRCFPFVAGPHRSFLLYTNLAIRVFLHVSLFLLHSGLAISDLPPFLKTGTRSISVYRQ